MTPLLSGGLSEENVPWFMSLADAARMGAVLYFMIMIRSID